MPATKATSRDLTAEVAFLTRALTAPTLRESVSRLADRARSASEQASIDRSWAFSDPSLTTRQGQVCW